LFFGKQRGVRREDFFGCGGQPTKTPAYAATDIMTVPIKCTDDELIAACSMAAEENPTLPIVGVMTRELLEAMLFKLDKFEKG